jgi:hypothetical protein
LRVNFLASKGRVVLHRAHPADLGILPRRPSFSWVFRCSQYTDEEAGAAGCRYQELVPADSPKPKVCPRCGAKVEITTSDMTEYAWFIWGPGRGNRWWILDEVADPDPVIETAQARVIERAQRTVFDL